MKIKAVKTEKVEVSLVLSMEEFMLLCVGIQRLMVIEDAVDETSDKMRLLRLVSGTGMISVNDAQEAGSEALNELFTNERLTLRAEPDRMARDMCSYFFRQAYELKQAVSFEGPCPKELERIASLIKVPEEA